MRRGEKPNWLFLNSALVGVNLGSDFCAEHEWGINEMKKAFGIPERTAETAGVVSRTITKVPESFGCYAHTSKDVTLWAGVYDGAETLVRYFRNELSMGYDEKLTLAGAWSEKDFGVRATDAQGIKHIREIFEAIQKLDAAIFLAGGGVFQNAGLSIAIRSRLPEYALKQMRDGDLIAIERKKGKVTK